MRGPFFQSIGAKTSRHDEQTPKPRHLPRRPPLEFPACRGPHGFVGLGYWSFASTATICNVKEIISQKVGSRYTGLRICYNDGSSETLGQWIGDAATSHATAIAKVYDSLGGPLHSITFYYSGFDPHHSYIVDICAGDSAGLVEVGDQERRSYVWRASNPDARVSFWGI